MMMRGDGLVNFIQMLINSLKHFSVFFFNFYFGGWDMLTVSKFFFLKNGVNLEKFGKIWKEYKKYLF